ncbi:MAG TPA: DUF4331 domain-containing protein [Terriglobales bacterium]|nr:DUF4331 domain-containing protein [Terriglobales bacterium]
MKTLFVRLLSCVLVVTLAIPTNVFASSHREAPITALDRTADVTDWYAFCSFGRPGCDRVTMIINVDPFLEPSNGPNYFPFDPNVLYEMKVDNDQDAEEDITFQFRFKTEIRAPGVFTGYVGGIAGIPPITSLDGPGSAGLSLRQTYTVTMVRKGVATELSHGYTLFAVPSNVGPRTMPDYDNLFNQGIYDLGNGVRVFAGTVADPFFIDLGAAFDSLNFRMGVGGVMTPAEDADDTQNFAPNSVAGFNVNSIVLEVPTTMLTVDGKPHPASDKQAVIGTYGSTARQRITIRRSPNQVNSARGAIKTEAEFRQVNREGNSLINELIIGTGSKDRFSVDDPKNDGQFANFLLDPLLAHIFASIGIPVPAAPRTDLLPLVQYMAPICPGCGPNDHGPIADLLRLNTGIPPTPAGSQKRLGFLAGDNAGFPNGRRLNDDVVDIAARVVAGVLVPDFNKAPNNLIGDGVNTSDVGFGTSFPYVLPAHSGRNSHHVAPGQAGCSGQAGGICPVN